MRNEFAFIAAVQHIFGAEGFHREAMSSKFHHYPTLITSLCFSDNIVKSSEKHSDPTPVTSL
jgi:hypothetical protein